MPYLPQHRQKRITGKIAGMTSEKKLINQSGCFDDEAVFNWQLMKYFENRRCLCVSITVCVTNPKKYILNTLEFAHVKTGQTSEERVAIVKTTTQQIICYQANSLIYQLLLSNPPEITLLNMFYKYCGHDQ